MWPPAGWSHAGTRIAHSSPGKGPQRGRPLEVDARAMLAGRRAPMRIKLAMSIVLGAMLALATIGLPAHAQDRTIGERVDDAAITAKVKAKLVADRAGNLVKVNVETKDGMVTLLGTVPKPEDKARAEELTRL